MMFELTSVSVCLPLVGRLKLILLAPNAIKKQLVVVIVVVVVVVVVVVIVVVCLCICVCFVVVC